MSLTRLKYGIETDSRERGDDSSGIGWIVVAIIVVAAISFIVTVAGRISSDSPGEEKAGESVLTIEQPAEKPVPPALKDVPPVEIDGFEGRSPKVRSLLMRLEKAAERGELEMQISTIEQIREMHGADSADLVEELLPRLGQLNLSWLFDRHNPQWVSKVRVKSGDTALRIAKEHGSTLASLKKLNGLSDAHRLVVGRELRVMNHPRFYLVLRMRLRTVDLYLNGKIFKRYYIPDDAGDIVIKPGDYRTPANLIDYFRRSGVNLRDVDLDELNMLVPRNSRFNVSPS